MVLTVRVTCSRRPAAAAAESSERGKRASRASFADSVICSAKLNLIDLAGSERIAKSGAKGVTLIEAQAINK